MLDTNSIIQAGQVAQQLLSTLNSQRSQLSPWLPALAVAAAWLGRELNRLTDYAERAAPKIIAHGGIAKILWKLIWN
jgi:hypothetical protein